MVSTMDYTIGAILGSRGCYACDIQTLNAQMYNTDINPAIVRLLIHVSVRGLWLKCIHIHHASIYPNSRLEQIAVRIPRIAAFVSNWCVFCNFWLVSRTTGKQHRYAILISWEIWCSHLAWCSRATQILVINFNSIIIAYGFSCIQWELHFILFENMPDLVGRSTYGTITSRNSLAYVKWAHSPSFFLIRANIQSIICQRAHKMCS